MSTRIGLVQRLWSYCYILRDDGVSYGNHLEQLIYLTGAVRCCGGEPARGEAGSAVPD